MRAFLVPTIVGIAMLAAAAPSHAQSITIGSNGVYISPSNRTYVPYQSYQSYYVTPSYQYQYGMPSYSYTNYPNTSSYRSGWNNGWYYPQPQYHQGYWHNGHYHPGHWQSGDWHRGYR